MNTGEKIKWLRKQLGYSAEYVAEKVGVSPSTIYRYENNDIASMKIDNLKLIAQILHTDAMDLLGWYEDEPVTVHVAPYEPSFDDSLSPAETVLLEDFRLLNEEGQDIVLKTTHSLVAGGQFKKTDSENSVG